MTTKMNAVELKTDEVTGITLVAADPRHWNFLSFRLGARVIPFR